MTRQNSFVAALLLFFGTAVAQYDNNWYFGQWAGMNFTGGTPTALTDNSISTIEATAVMSDINGELLFYTNGVTVRNKNHQTMPNGFGLFGDHSSSQGAIIIPKPGVPQQYYLFTADDVGGPFGLNYTEIDMSLDGGLGAVTSPNNPLLTPVCEKITAVHHANGNDIWITTHHWGSDAFYSYLVTSAGVNPIPVISNVGTVVEGVYNSGRYSGNMSISPDGTKLAIANNSLALEYFNFDTSTGKVNNPVTLYNGECYGVAFSSSGRMLYANEDKILYQYDTAAVDIPASKTAIDTLTMPGGIRLAPDGKIYVIKKMALDTALSVINAPNEPGTACQYVSDQMYLAGKKTFGGLPAFLTNPLYILDINALSDCAGTSATFSLVTTIVPESVNWDFGDGGTSFIANPVHTYAAPGNYTVTAFVRNGIFGAYLTEDITISPGLQPIANTPEDMEDCDAAGDTQSIFVLTSQDAQILGSQPAADFTISYHLTAVDAQTNANALPVNYPNTSSPQEIFARITAKIGGCYAITSFSLIVFPRPDIDMPDSYGLCSGNSVTITAPAGFDSYLWSTGETTSSIIVDTAGAYTITVTKNHGIVTCAASLTVNVVPSSAPVLSNVEISDWTDRDNSIVIHADGFGTYEFSIDGTNYQDSNIFSGLLPGVYTVYARDKNGCGLAAEEVALLMYPRYFTPNEDGQHDTWHIKQAYFEPDMHVYIYDRYGKLLGSLTGTSAGWTGNYNGNSLPSTDYWFVAERQNGREYKGHFSMKR